MAASTDSLPISSTLQNTTMHLVATPQIISLTPTTDDTDNEHWVSIAVMYGVPLVGSNGSK